MGIQRIKPTPPFICCLLSFRPPPCHSGLLHVIPAKAGIPHRKRALRAPSGRSEGVADSHKLAPPPAAAIARMCAFRALFALDSGFPGCVKTPKIQNRTKKFPTGMANIRQKRHEIPTQTLISYDFECYFPTLQKARIVFTQTGKPESRANRARNAHIRAMAPAGDGASLWLSAAPSSRHEGARSARFICGIPAFAGMT